MTSSSKSSSQPHLGKAKLAELARAFKRADSDGDGCLTKDEYIGVYRDQGVNISDEDAEDLFKDKDKDRDGKISYDEFIGDVSREKKIVRNNSFFFSPFTS